MITEKLLGIRFHKVIFGFDATREMIINRSELEDKLDTKNFNFY